MRETHKPQDSLQFWTKLLITRQCEKCSGIMRLALIMPGKTGQDVRTFECIKCHNREQHLVSWH